MRRLLILLLLLSPLLLLPGCGRPSLEDDPVSKEYVLLLHNKERALKDLEQLLIDSDLDIRAQEHAEWMASHTSLTHSKLGGSDFNYMGENIAMGQEDEVEVVDDWMHSSGHRRNILSKNYTHAGIGYARFKDGRPYWCVVFGG